MMIEYIGLMCLTVLLTNSTPILMLRDKIGLFEMRDSNPEWKNRLIELLSCSMCLGFWVGISYMIFTYDPLTAFFSACIIAIGSEFINKLLRR